ncbi:MAG: hypothetical protein BA870_01505 [Desulfuromonadales bacterium C00003094]|jgi:hypothetical protein|nr:MAG: hypothetical protein BA870_01505 [Desulfuromonadales bacterium C00003094]
MGLSRDEYRVIACMRAVSKAGRRQIVWQAQQVAKLEKLLSEWEQNIGHLRQCLDCGNQNPEQVQVCSDCSQPASVS